MANLDAALALTVEKFSGITDKDGQPYILHCLRVMQGVQGEEAQMVALMHDLIEDTDVTLEDLKSLGFSPAVLKGLDLITHKAEASYADYIQCLEPNELARAAKISDLEDNYSLHRVAFRPGFEYEDRRRIQRYILSHQFLTERIQADEYTQRIAEFEESI
ncbi:MAG: GTP pyrophosphokinase [Planctomycetota bacterium]